MACITRILDNDSVKVADQLKHSLVGDDTLRIATAFFNVSGYDVLADYLRRLDDIRILIGAPKSIGGLSWGATQTHAFEWTDEGRLTPTQTPAARAR